MDEEELREEVGFECDFKDESERRVLQEDGSILAEVQTMENSSLIPSPYSTFSPNPRLF